ncbi:hypothetical protein JCM10207_001709 [Rhodosporidiobolus poonsookiae]
MANHRNQNSNNLSRGVATTDVAPLANFALAAHAGPHAVMATPSRNGFSICTTSLSPVSPPASSFSDDDLSDTDYDSDILPPSYSLYSPTSPVSSLGTSPADSFHFGKAGAVAPVLSPPYSAQDANPFDAASLLHTVFPGASAPVHALPATNVDLADLIGVGWKGAVVNDAAAGLRTLYVAGGELKDLELREAVVDVIDRAEEQWGVTGVVLCLEKNMADLGNLVHGLTYVGFTPLHKDGANEDLLLLALDLA